MDKPQPIECKGESDTEISHGGNMLTNAQIYWIRIIASLISGVLFILYLTFPGLRIDVVALSLLILAMLPWLVPYLQNFLESGKVFGTEFKFLKNKVEVHGKQIKSQQEVIRLIYESLRRSLTQYEYHHLVDLESDRPYVEYKYCPFLEMEMIRLCQHGYVDEVFHDSTWTMKERGTFNLKEIYRITDSGREHLKLLKDLQALIAS